MRIYRFALLQSYFSIINKNKKKALILINAGIFFTIFAISSAAISFFIEKNISDKQNELIYLQISSKEYSKSISSFENTLNSMVVSVDSEAVDRSEKFFSAEQKLGAQINNTHDYFGPPIYYTLKTIETLDKFFHALDFEYYNVNDPIYREFIEIAKTAWTEDQIEYFTDSIKEFEIFYKKMKKLNADDYSYKSIPSLKDITKEILNYKDDGLNYETKLRIDYSDSVEFDISFITFFEQLLKFFRSSKGFTDMEIQRINKEIINLSKNEKNIILVTFIFQFVIFCIIQVFEVSSMNYSLKTLKRNK